MRVYASLILGAKNMKKKLTAVEKRAALIIKYRKLKVRKKEREGDRITISLSRGDVKYVLLCVAGQRNIGIAYVRELKELVEKTGARARATITSPIVSLYAFFFSPFFPS